MDPSTVTTMVQLRLSNKCQLMSEGISYLVME